MKGVEILALPELILGGRVSSGRAVLWTVSDAPSLRAGNHSQQIEQWSRPSCPGERLRTRLGSRPAFDRQRAHKREGADAISSLRRMQCVRRRTKGAKRSR